MSDLNEARKHLVRLRELIDGGEYTQNDLEDLCTAAQANLGTFTTVLKDKLLVPSGPPKPQDSVPDGNLDLNQLEWLCRMVLVNAAHMYGNLAELVADVRVEGGQLEYTLDINKVATAVVAALPTPIHRTFAAICERLVFEEWQTHAREWDTRKEETVCQTTCKDGKCLLVGGNLSTKDTSG